MKPVNPEQSQECKTCGKRKDFSEFTRQQGGRNHLKPHCKPCLAKNTKARRRLRPIYEDLRVLEQGTTKTCAACKRERLIENFDARPYYKGLRWPSCKECFAKKRAVAEEWDERMLREFLPVRTLGPCQHCGAADPHKLRVTKGKFDRKIMAEMPLVDLPLYIGGVVLCHKCHMDDFIQKAGAKYRAEKEARLKAAQEAIGASEEEAKPS